MSSPLERALLRLQVCSKGLSLRHFLALHLAVQDILNLRLTSRSLHGLAKLNELAFKEIYIHTAVPPGRKQHADALKAIGSLCRHVTVKIVCPPKASRSPGTASIDTGIVSPHSDGGSDAISTILDLYCPYVEPPIAWKFVVQRKSNDVDQGLLRQWCEIFKLLPKLEILHIACNGDPAWPGCTDIESALILSRITLERVNPEHIHTVCLSPIHAMGIVHLRWAGAGAYGKACASRNPVWYRLKVLKLGILSPYPEGRLSASQKQLFEKIFADYLQSFSRTLIKLKLSWFGAAGLNPFFTGDGHQNMRLTRTFDRLEELQLDNVNGKCDTLVLKQLAPSLQRLVVASDAPNVSGQTVHEHWRDHLGQAVGTDGNDNARWMTLRDVRISAIPEPLFQHRHA